MTDPKDPHIGNLLQFDPRTTDATGSFPTQGGGSAGESSGTAGDTAGGTAGGTPGAKVHFGKKSSRFKRGKRRTPPGSTPGTIVSDPAAPKPVVELISYNESGFVEKHDCTLEDLRRHVTGDAAIGNVNWINVDGLGDAEIVRQIGEIFDLHPLALEDVVNVHQRPKLEEYDEFLFVTARMPLDSRLCETEQLSLFLKQNAVITFQERSGGDCLVPVRDRVRKGRGKIRTRRVDYLVYAILDVVIDAYFPILERLSEQMENLEDQTMTNPSPQTIAAVHAIKQDLITVRRAIWPLRDALNVFLRDSSGHMSEETRVYMRDCYDHTVQIIELVETYRELCSDLMDIYLSMTSNRMNEVMKVLTVISTIFMPLTFIAGVYGMNFNTERSPLNMPELNWYYGYPLSLGAMFVVSLALLAFFRRKGWL